MSEKSPKNQNHQESKQPTSPEKALDGLEMDVSRAQPIADHIHEYSKGKGTTPEVVDELYEKLELLEAAENSKETASNEETTPASKKEQSERVQDARDGVAEAIEKPSDKTQEKQPVVQNREKGSVEDDAMHEQIDAIDKIRNYEERHKKIREYALHNNGVVGPDGKDIGVEAAKRIDSSSARSKLNPRRYILKFGRARRHHNSLLSEMAKGGPNGANLKAAEAMKRNWDPRYRKIVPGKNETLYKVSEIFERQMKDLPDEIQKLERDRDALLNREPSNKGIVEETKHLATLKEGLDNTTKQAQSTQDKYEKTEDKKEKEILAEKIKVLKKNLEDIEQAIQSTESKLDELTSNQRQLDKKEADKKQTKIKESQDKYNYSAQNTLLVDGGVNDGFMHAHKYRGKIKANRATQRDDINLLGELDKFGHRRKRQEALGEIIIRRVSNVGNLSPEEIQNLKSESIQFVNKNIRNKKIRDKTIKKIV